MKQKPGVEILDTVREHGPEEMQEAPFAEKAGAALCLVRDVLLGRSDWEVPAVSPASPLLEALALMEELGAPALAVTEGTFVVGLLSRGDCAGRVILEGKDPGRTTVGDVMSRPPRTVSASTPVAECLDIMIEGGIGHLPVLFGTYLVGCVSLRDLVGHLGGRRGGEDGETSDRLRSYISRR